MRARMILLVTGILLVAGFAALNWSELLRTAPLSFGVVVTEAPLGLIMLVLLLASIVVFIAGSAVQQTQSLLDSRQYAKELQTQRELADKAEASRFTELRQHMDAQLREVRERDTLIAARFEASLATHQQESRALMEQISRQIARRTDLADNSSML